MASTDAIPVPRKNVAYRLTFALYKNDGTLITDAAGLDSEVSKDGGTFADCTNEATEIATSSGFYYLDLTSTEMNADCVAIMTKTSSTGAVIPTWVLYPQETGDIKVDVTSFGGTAGAFASGIPDVRLADAIAHGGTLGSSTATLALSRLSVVSQSSNTAALTVTGNGTGNGAMIASGAGATGTGLAVSSAATNGTALTLAGVGTGNGLTSTGGATGHGISGVGGATSGNGIRAAGTAGNSAAMNLVGQGSAAGLLTTGGATGVGASFVGGATSGAGLLATGTAGNSPAASLVGQGSAAGLLSTGGATGHGISAVGGATSGDGLRAAAATSGVGITATGVGTTQAGIVATGGSTSSNGITATGGGTGSGIAATSGSGATGNGLTLLAASTNGHGLKSTGTGTGDGAELTAGASGADLDADIAGTLTTVTTATNLTNAATAGDFTATMKTSIGTAVAASAVASVTGNVGGNVTGSVGSIAAGGISEASYATTAGSVYPLGIIDQGTAQSATGTTLVLRSAAAFASTELVGATIVITGGSTGVGQSRVITAYNGGTDTATVDAWTTTPTGTITYKIFATAPGNAPTAAQIADQVWEETLADHSGTSGSTAAALNAAGAAGDPWSTALPGAYGSGTAGKIIGDNINATISSRASQTSLDTLDDYVDTEVGAIKTKTDFLPSATAGAAGGLFIAGTNAATTITTGLTANITGNLSGSVGSVTGNVGGTVATVTNLTNAPTAGDFTATMKTSIGTAVAASAVASVTGNVGGNVTGSVGSIASGGIAAASFAANAITASAIAADAIGASELAADAVTEIQSGLATAANLATVDTVVDAIKVTTDKLDTAMELDVAVYRFTTNALEQAPTGGSAPSAATIADAVWDELIAGHAVSGSTGEALAAAGGAGDPWITALPGSYSAGQAGYIVGTNLNATVGSRATQTSVDDLPTNAELATALGTADDAVLAAIAALNNLSAAGVRSAIGLASANLDTQLDALPTNAELATALAAADDAVLAAISALNNLSSAQAQTAAAAALTAYDPPTRAEATSDANSILTAVGDVPSNAELATALAGADDAVLAAIAALNNLSVANILGATIEGATTLVQSIRLANAALGGKASGLETTSATYRDLADTKNRIVATVDADGNRTAVTRDLS